MVARSLATVSRDAPDVASPRPRPCGWLVAVGVWGSTPKNAHSGGLGEYPQECHSSELGRAFLADGGEALLGVGAEETHELVGEGGVEGGIGVPEPVVQGVLGEGEGLG